LRLTPETVGRFLSAFIGGPSGLQLERTMNLKPNTPPVNANKKSRLFEPVA